MIISLKDVVTTGSFGPVKLCITKKDAISFLGKPEAAHETPDGGILFYGKYELFYNASDFKIYGFQNDRLLGGYNNHHEMILFPNKKFTIDPWFIEVGKEYSLTEVKNILDAENIQYEFDENKEIISFPSGAFLSFSTGYEGWGTDNEYEPQKRISVMYKESLLCGIHLYTEPTY